MKKQVLKNTMERVDIRKASIFAIVINSIQILMVGIIVIYIFFSPQPIKEMPVTRYAVLLAGALVCWGAMVDIREAKGTRKTMDQVEAMEKTMDNMEELNNTLRAQRHDFLNHLQVVYSLMEMQEYKDAQDYIEKVYGDIRAVSRVMRTANPAVNALMQVKLASCEKENIQVELKITSAWRDLSIPGWEMCRVLSNLIDNAMDALREVEDRKLILSLSEDLKAFRFSVANNGPMIPPAAQGKIFQPGITTKSQGHGMGLHIVKQTLRNRGGDIALESGSRLTVFSGWVPKDLLGSGEEDGIKSPENAQIYHETLQNNN